MTRKVTRRSSARFSPCGSVIWTSSQQRPTAPRLDIGFVSAITEIVRAWRGRHAITIKRRLAIEIRQESIAALDRYADIPIAFDVREIMEVATDPGSSRFTLTSRRVPIPYVKDYDAISGEGPRQWAGRFDLSGWAFFAAFIGDERIGGAAVARGTAALDLLEGRDDLAALWDIRVAPSRRRCGAGRALFAAAVSWASAAGCRLIRVETQNVNVAACRFYARNGCVLRAVNRGVYPEFPEEVQLLWDRDLSPPAT